VDDPAATPRAFEEMLRHQLPLQFVGRTMLVDAEVAGVDMRAGQRVLLLLSCANRDEQEFSDPERFDAGRVMERHLGFGHGVHVCIGAHVARLEGVVLVQELLARHPGYEVVETGLARECSEFHVGWARMPIAPH
jgi:cytochrome P450